MTKLYLLTDYFPYGTGEKTFILPEIEVLKEEYEITIISTAGRKLTEQRENVTQLDKSIGVMRFCADEERKWLYYMQFLRFWIKKDCWYEVKEIFRAREKVLARVWKSMHFYARAECLYHWIRRNNIIGREKAIYYSYWYNDKVLAMTMHKREYPDLKIIARAHGYDLYAERKNCGWQPYKKVMDGKIDKLFFISKHGLNYYALKYGFDIKCNRYKLCRIGCKKQEATLEKERNNEFLLVSCSSLIPLKRVDLIINALSKIKNCNIRWVHFGSGCQYGEIEKLAHQQLDFKPNIKYCINGQTRIEDIMRFYSTEKPDCFLTTSSSEGCPVSIQEALAFGMPIIGTNVGGISETIDGNGYLLRENPLAEEVAQAIENMYFMEQESYNAMRRKSLEIWEKNFNVDKNMNEFVEVIRDMG